jgi:predicted ATP-dependent endonuclease of OLD family
MRYTKFTINNFKAIRNVTIDLSKEGLILLLGINESGKTSVLRAIEAFDQVNDLEDQNQRARFIKSIRNKKELNSQASVLAELILEKGDSDKILLSLGLDEEKGKLLKKIDRILISRNFLFENANFVGERYSLDLDLDQKDEIFGELDEIRETEICKKILSHAPSIQYFEDFKDQIPDFISLTPGAQYYDSDWASTIEGLFFHTDREVSVQQFQNLTDADARKTVLNKVNKVLNKQFTERWNKKLKGAKQISRADLEYDADTRLFTFKIIGPDKATVFAVEERSKGALWYLTFLLKTEFRKKKLRAQSGKTLYLIDEPASNLHSSAQLTMLEDFRTLASDSNVIYTTHSQYLIDKENLTNVYIVENARGIVKVVKYQEYVRGKSIQTSYFQPILDALQVQPFSLDFSWNKVLIVEGIYDYCGFNILFFEVLGEEKKFVIMPGTGAASLSSLISLHIGWGADISVMLDNDEEGRSNQARYIEKYPNLTDVINVYDFLDLELTKENIEFEDLFEEKEKKEIIRLASIETENIDKKIFQQALLIIACSEKLKKSLSKIIGQETKTNFRKILDKVKKNLRIDS